MSKNTGGPAFPCGLESGHLEPLNHGMSLRDYFAAKAMQGIWTNTDLLAQLPPGGASKAVARMAYEMADAMIEAREAA
jgi:hypothetical protein